MKVLLIDIDSKIPNIALMKIAQYHKKLGDEVGFNITEPDKIYASVIFKKNKHKTDRMKALKRWTRPQIFWSIDFDEYVSGVI